MVLTCFSSVNCYKAFFLSDMGSETDSNFKAPTSPMIRIKKKAWAIPKRKVSGEHRHANMIGQKTDVGKIQCRHDAENNTKSNN